MLVNPVTDRKTSSIKEMLRVNDSHTILGVMF